MFDFNRKVYKDIKKMDRQEMEKFLEEFYKASFLDGMEKAEEKGISKEKLTAVLDSVKGIGEKRKAEVMEALEK